VSGCGPHQGANVDHFIDCVGDGCDSSYQDKVRKFRGPSGEDSISTQTISTSTIVVIEEEQIQGPKGDQGEAGQNGADGDSCTVSTVPAGSLIQCEDGSSSLVYNGTDGEDGESPLLDIVDPCGQETQFDEVLLVYEIDGELVYIAYFQSGNNRRLAQLDEYVNYVTTDGSSCEFRIEDGQLVEL
jgi:hypothetical protein